ncbi:uncharacterized protein VTP21DRAFT_6982 [Calcarisporiella thermophila]|uniref:uncharacterized protein n=1 Tax=Calcarisporiella thermophila TaxID=911321 RepID=UPI003743E9CE
MASAPLFPPPAFAVDQSGRSAAVFHFSGEPPAKTRWFVAGRPAAIDSRGLAVSASPAARRSPWRMNGVVDADSKAGGRCRSSHRRLRARELGGLASGLSLSNAALQWGGERASAPNPGSFFQILDSDPRAQKGEHTLRSVTARCRLWRKAHKGNLCSIAGRCSAEIQKPYFLRQTWIGCALALPDRPPSPAGSPSSAFRRLEKPRNPRIRISWLFRDWQPD